MKIYDERSRVEQVGFLTTVIVMLCYVLYCAVLDMIWIDSKYEVIVDIVVVVYLCFLFLVSC